MRHVLLAEDELEGPAVSRSNVTADEYRQTLRRWPSGVTVVTVGVADRTHGLTVSAFASVCAEPPTILVCINGGSRAHAMIRDRPSFVVNILSAGQRDVAEFFAHARGEAGLAGIPHHPGTVAGPLLDGAAATLECSVVQSLTVGTHIAYFGRVEVTEVSGLDPLLYFDGSYQGVIFGRRQKPR